MESQSSTVFVGNIPYDVTEEQLADRFRVAGEVLRFRIQMDLQTGKTKGFGFCEYASPESALNAIRTLNGIEVNGRQLRVDAGKDKDPSKPRQARDLEAALGQLTVAEVYDILEEFKAWLKRDADAAKELLVQRPVLAQALLKMQTHMNMTTAPPADALFSTYLTSAPQPQPAMLPPPQPLAVPNPEAYALLNQALSMTEEQISAFPLQQQELLRQIRAANGIRR